MSNLMRVMKKEIKELLTFKTVLPIIAFALLFGFIGQMAGGAVEQPEEKPVVSLIDADDSDLSREIVDVLENKSEVVYFSSDRADTREAFNYLEEEGGIAVITLPKGFEENIFDNRSGSIEVLWKKEGFGLGESIPTGKVNALLEVAGDRVTRKLILEEAKLDTDVILNPIVRSETTYVRGREFKGIAPGQIDSAMSLYNSLVPIVIMIILIMSGGQVIESMGLEKGNKTLETLLTLPIKRSHIAMGKILGSAVVGLSLAAIYMIGFGYFQMSFQPGAIDMGALGLEFGLLDYGLLTVSLALTIIAGLAICMVLGSFSSDYKSAQMRMFPLIILVFIPFFLSMFASFHTLPLVARIIMFIIPFSHPMMAVGALMFNDYLLVISGIIYVTLFAVLTIALVSYVFSGDTLLTGRFEVKWLQKVLKIFRK